MKPVQLTLLWVVCVLVCCQDAQQEPSAEVQALSREAGAKGDGVLEGAGDATPGIESMKADYEIVSREIRLKGGSVEPLIRPRYKLLYAKAALVGQGAEFTEEDLEATLQALLMDLRREPGIDGVSVHLYQSLDHTVGGNAAIGLGEWWPKGHSFAPENAANILNKSTYETTVDVWNIPRMATDDIVSRISESTRREIFTALVRTEDRADRDARTKFPIDDSLLSRDPEKYRQHVTDMMKAQYEESGRLVVKYQAELRARYNISEQELDSIKHEALQEGWPLPPSE